MPKRVTFAMGAALLASSWCRQPAFSQTTARWRLEQDLVVGVGATTLRPTDPLLVATNGAITVVDDRARELSFYSPSGRELIVAGGLGSGRGEFGFVRRYGLCGDSLWVFDSERRSVSLFSRDGKYLGARQVKPLVPPSANPQSLPGFTYTEPVAVYGNGSMASVGYASGSEPGSEADFLVFDRGDGLIRNVLARLPSDDAYLSVSNGIMRIPFAYEPFFVASADGRYFAIVTMHAPRNGSSSGQYSVVLERSSGDTVFSRTVPFVGEPISPAAIDSAIHFIADAGHRGESGVASLNAARARIPSVYAPVTTVFVGRDSSVWLGMRPASGERRWLVLRRDGSATGAVTLPADVMLKEADGVHTWGIRGDPDAGTVALVRYRILE
ncbi:MAG TPA: hypothetical protein VMH39_13845 [Gemmatimonadaceae bacterium]|nr:hypothetical protein [Gemmatimonadaceae bacterium]